MITLISLALAAKSLQVQGTKIFYGSAEVRLRGVCVGDIVLARDERPLSDYTTIRAWGANCVRIGVAPPTWKKMGKKALPILRKEVDIALRNGLFVIIDWHSIGWPDGYFEKPKGEEDLYDSSLSLAMDFWKACAKEYRSNGAVAFQLWCEPVFQKEDWNTPMGSTWEKLKPSFDKMIGTVRKEGAKNMVLASGNRWAYDLVGIRKNPLKDSNVAYMWHVYGGHDDNKPDLWAKALDDLHTVAPVIATEWGFERETKSHYKGNPDNFGKPFLSFMESRGMHWTAWCFHNSWGPAMLNSKGSGTTEFGGFVKSALGKLNAKAIRP